MERLSLFWFRVECKAVAGLRYGLPLGCFSLFDEAFVSCLKECCVCVAVGFQPCGVHHPVVFSCPGG